MTHVLQGIYRGKIFIGGKLENRSYCIYKVDEERAKNVGSCKCFSFHAGSESVLCYIEMIIIFVLYCTALSYTLLYCTVLHCSVLYCTVLFCPILYYTVLFCPILYCTVLYCTVLYCTVLYCTVLYCTVLYCTVLYCTVLYCTVLYISTTKELKGKDVRVNGPTLQVNQQSQFSFTSLKQRKDMNEWNVIGVVFIDPARHLIV